MANNKQIAADIIEAVGGRENIASAFHCVTRLRLNLKDYDIVNDDEVDAIKGVIGTNRAAGHYQIIIGPGVQKVYDEVIALGVPGAGEVALTDDEKGELTPKEIGGLILNYISKTMLAVVPIITAAGLLRTIGVIFGPTVLGLLSEDSVTYNLFYTWLFQATFYFLPLSLGWAAASQLGASPVYGLMMGGILMAPPFLEYAAEGLQTVNIFGVLPVKVNDYTFSVLPIMLCMPVLAFVEKKMRQLVPDSLQLAFVPFLTMLIMAPLALCVLAPIGSWLAEGLAFVINTLGTGNIVLRTISMVFLAASFEFLVMTGTHQVLVNLSIAQLLATGTDSLALVAQTFALFSVWGMCLGAWLRLKDPEEKGNAMSFFVAGILGGVTEPALFGLAFKHTRCFAGIVIGGAVGGFIAAVTNVTMYVFGTSNFTYLADFVAGGTFNMACATGAALISFAVSCIVTYLFGFTRQELEADRAAAAEAAKAAA